MSKKRSRKLFFLNQPKKQGEWSELCFMARAAEHGLTVSKPWGDTARYDLVVERNGHFYRVQVKSSAFGQGRSWVCNIHCSSKIRNYDERQIDFLAAYIIPENVWYIIPAKVIQRLSAALLLTPDDPHSKYRPYQEAWWLLSGDEQRKIPLSRPKASFEIRNFSASFASHMRPQRRRQAR